MDKKALVEALKPITDRVRTDVTAKKKSNGSQIWTNEPLSDELMMRHVNGGPARGCCPIREGQSVTMVATFDMDSHKGEVPWEEMASEAARIIETLEEQGLYAIPFRSSGGSGIHLYLIWDEPQDAYSVRMALNSVLAKCGYRDGTKGVKAREIEIFPKQDSISMGEKGSQIILPLAGQSVPLELMFDLEPMSKEHVAQVKWLSSLPVELLQKPAPVPAALPDISWDEFEKAVLSIDNSKPCHDPEGIGYDEWFRILCGIKHMDQGEKGKGLAKKFSIKNPDFKLENLAKAWKGIKIEKGDREKFATAGTTMIIARQRGYLGDVLDDFDESNVEKEELQFKRDKNGIIKSLIENVTSALQRSDFLGFEIAKDTFRDNVLIRQLNVDKEWRVFMDSDYTQLRLRLADLHFAPVGREMMRDAVDYAIRENEFNSAQSWLSSLKWDGVCRVETFFKDYFSVEDTPYTRAVSLYMWSALAGRVASPGCKADMVPVLVGDQGVGKSTAVSKICPQPDFFKEISFAEDDDKLSRKMRGCLIAEIAELKGLASKDNESIKAFIAKQYEEWTPKYKEFNFRFPRQNIFIGTTNEEEFLSDPTGNRRWLPLRVGKVDTQSIEDNRDMLWAEALVIFERDGVHFEAAERLAKSEHGQFELRDSWDEMISDWLKTDDPATFEPHSSSKFLMTKDILTLAIGMDKSRINTGYERKLSGCMKRLGYTLSRIRVDGKRIRVYEKIEQNDSDVPF